MKVLAVIPARYASTRLMGKPLADICGKPMVQHVYERVRQATLVDEVLVATDDARIMEVVQSFDGTAVLTSPDCASGTDRLVEIARSHLADIYLNIQGDEPLLRPQDVDALVAALRDTPDVAAATLCYPISAEQAQDPALVKVVRDYQGRALYFSRAAIPFVRDADTASVQYWGHAGLYAYRPHALRAFGRHPQSPLEAAEKLEQLRLLQMGMPMLTVEVAPCAPGVDTAEDLEAVRAIVREEMDANAADARAVALADMRAADPALSVGDTRISPELAAKLRKIKLIITDVDGVLTDGSLYYGPEGECIKKFNARDGVAIKMLQQAGIQVAVLSGRDCPALRARMKDLGITIFRVGQQTKGEACKSIIAEAGVSKEETLYIGDDLPDLEAFACCGCSVAVSDAATAVRQTAQMVLQACGGGGALREVAEVIMGTAQGAGI
ncbi:MAG: 3-deoxy-manno-octulosonate cytidylyltransferase [Desulfovibrio sp.]|nr:3-deoxy-manno-octulosonate cytidylyltransferase [Desulfovibrio sp.]